MRYNNHMNAIKYNKIIKMVSSSMAYKNDYPIELQYEGNLVRIVPLNNSYCHGFNLYQI